MWSPGVYLLALLIDMANIVAQGFFLVMFGDLETDYINPIDLCNKLNPWIAPEMALQAANALMLLFTGHWFSFVIMAPIMAYNAYLVSENRQVLDATEIFKTVSRNKRDSFIKLLLSLFLFFYFLFHTIVAFIGWEDQPMNLE